MTKNIYRYLPLMLCAAALALVPMGASAQLEGSANAINIHKSDGSLISYAADSVTSVVFNAAAGTADSLCAEVDTKAGEKFFMLFTDAPQITFDGDTVAFAYKDAAARLHIASLARITFADYTTVGVKSAALKAAGIKEQGGAIVADGLAPNTTIYIYDTSGNILLRKRAGASGKAVIPADTLSPDIYIVKAGSLTLKLEKK